MHARTRARVHASIGRVHAHTSSAGDHRPCLLRQQVALAAPDEQPCGPRREIPPRLGLAWSCRGGHPTALGREQERGRSSDRPEAPHPSATQHPPHQPSGNREREQERAREAHRPNLEEVLLEHGRGPQLRHGRLAARVRQVRRVQQDGAQPVPRPGLAPRPLPRVPRPPRRRVPAQPLHQPPQLLQRLEVALSPPPTSVRVTPPRGMS